MDYFPITILIGRANPQKNPDHLFGKQLQLDGDLGAQKRSFVLNFIIMVGFFPLHKTVTNYQRTL